MDRNKSTTQPIGQGGAETLKCGGNFKIPKKKRISEMDNVDMHSPLSRLSDSRVESLKTSHKRWPFSYNSFNKTSNQDLIVYNQRKNSPSKRSFSGDGVHLKEARIVLKDVLMTDSGRRHLLQLKNRGCSNVENTDTSHPKHHTPTTSELTDNCHVETKTSHQASQSNILFSSGVKPERRSEHSIQKQNENSTKPKENHISPFRNSERATEDACRTGQIIGGNKSCEQKTTNESHYVTDLQTDPSTDSPLSSPRNKRLRKAIQDHCSQSDADSASPSKKNGEDSLKKQIFCPSCKKQTENCCCFSLFNNNGEEKELSTEGSKPESCVQHEQSLSHSSTKQQSPNSRNQELPNQSPSKMTTPDRKINGKEYPHISLSNELKTESSLRSQASTLKPAPVSIEPIVLSSDDEDTDKNESLLQSTKLTPEIKRLNLGRRSLSTESCNQEIVTASPRQPENKEQSTNEKYPDEVPEQNKPIDDATQTMDDSPCESSGTMESTLEIKFTALHMGGNEGIKPGSAVFAPEHILISFSALNSLSLDTSQLKKYSVWNRLSDVECHSVIFLWLAADYVDKIYEQLQTTLAKHESKSNEFIFIQLFEPLQITEATILKRVMTEIGARSGIADLCDMVPLEEACQLLAEFPSEKSSFISSCCKTLQQQVDMMILSQEPHLFQEENVNPMKPNNHTSCHIQRKDQSIGSTMPKQDKQRQILKSGPVTKIIVFPPPPTKGGLAVTTEDLECLVEGEFLNDVIIDFYLKYLLLEKAPKELAKRTHIFSSFFYRRLTRKDAAISEETTNLSIQHKRHQRVKTWTRHVDIFTKDFIFVPVNEESHWYLAVICFPALEKPVYESEVSSEAKVNKSCSTVSSNTEKINDERVSLDEPDTENSVAQDSSEDSSKTSDCFASPAVPLSRIQECIKAPIDLQQPKTRILKQPCILIMDSLRAASQSHTVKILREYLQIEWEMKREGQRNFTLDNMKGSVPRVPKQDNSSDCGIYLLQYVESFFQNPITNFELPLQLDKWFQRQEVKRKREEIRDLILQLHSQQRTDS
ncbi:sentrin-specific protease 7 isoform X1 [Callorhinchus milii]|nr:sentrin-specific protease 7 isoform X1 [Callorhinchus milii]|eukprot:gi/632956426/ref/XP_007893952.1/ PREDICTED: sentrin-specific protease 7 isoform X1 [Callorhinchus milii]